ncbi:glycosyltransferase family 2 protein [Pseudogemmobacter sonorensis]|uniref:glycosyltransferase family 2 protein n=1 Tax=Pseudogemmobacter sonorensis TaxID=2989681 RepID=UPI00369EC2EA
MWGVVATVKAPVEKVLAFVAHHLSLGAGHVWIYFDDPEDPAHEAVKRLPKVTATRCDAAWWQARGARPERHQNRQVKNARQAYLACRLPWIAHLDCDEFLAPLRPVDEILAEIPPEQIMVRAEPHEAVHDPALPDEIFTARLFRAALKGGHAPLLSQVIGGYADVLPNGLMSHHVGKAFFRTGIKALSPRLHGAFVNGTRLPGPPFHPDLRLLHFHAQDRAAWQAALPYRLTRGAYQYAPALQSFLMAATPGQVDDFYRKTQMLNADQERMLRSANRLAEADLRLRDKVAALPGGAGT